MPGALKYKFTKNVTFYSLDQDATQSVGADVQSIALKTNPSLVFDLSRNYTNLDYIPSVSYNATLNPLYLASFNQRERAVQCEPR